MSIDCNKLSTAKYAKDGDIRGTTIVLSLQYIFRI